jgi:hypothetical protein
VSVAGQHPNLRRGAQRLRELRDEVEARTGKRPWAVRADGTPVELDRMVARIDLATGHRECLQCDGWLPFAEFHKSKTGPGGRASTCRACILRNRAKADLEVWRQAVKVLGGRCHRCCIKVAVVLHLRAISDVGDKMLRQAGKRTGGSLARLVLAQGEFAAEHWTLECANCQLRREHEERTQR